MTWLILSLIICLFFEDKSFDVCGTSHIWYELWISQDNTVSTDIVFKPIISFVRIVWNIVNLGGFQVDIICQYSGT